MESASSQISMFSLSQILQAAMLSVPIVLTLACTMELAIGNSMDCRASGNPVRIIIAICSLPKCRCQTCTFPRRCSSLARNRKVRTTLTICAATVAAAAPPTPRCRTPTKRRSPKILMQLLTSSTYNGRFESPKARRIPAAIL